VSETYKTVFLDTLENVKVFFQMTRKIAKDPRVENRFMSAKEAFNAKGNKLCMKETWPKYTVTEQSYKSQTTLK